MFVVLLFERQQCLTQFFEVPEASRPQQLLLNGEVPELSGKGVELASQPQVTGADSPEPVGTEVAGFRELLAPGIVAKHC